MGAKTALRTRLTAISGVTGLVGTRIYQDWAPRDPTFPYVTFTQIGNEPHHHTGRASALALVRFQIDVWALTTASRENVAEAVRNAIDGYAGTSATVDVRRVLLTEKGADSVELATIGGREIPVFRARLEVELWHREAVPTLT